MFLRKLYSASAALLLCAEGLAAENAKTGGKETFSEDSANLGEPLKWQDVVGDKKVTILKDVTWSGNYYGGPGKNAFSIESGAIASGGNWDFAPKKFVDENGAEIHGYAEIMGAGTITAKIKMGNGDDTIGNFATNADDAAHNSLKLDGELKLGDGTNRVKAFSATKIIGGNQSDTVILLGNEILKEDGSKEIVLADVNLKNGSNRLEAIDIKKYTGGTGDDTVILSGSAKGIIHLFDGTNELQADGADRIEGGSGKDTIKLTGEAGEINLKGGQNILTAAIISSYSGGNGSDTVTLTGYAEGNIDLGGGASGNTLTVEEEIESNVTSTAAGLPDVWDKVFIVGGEADISLGNGSNKLAVSGDWEGDYIGGQHTDVITIEDGSAMTSSISGFGWNLGAGDNKIKGYGTISVEKIILGRGNDIIGNFGASAPDSDNKLTITSSVDLGDGVNKMKALAASNVKGGGGDDTIILASGSSVLDLKDGENLFSYVSSSSWVGSYKGGNGSDTVDIHGSAAGTIHVGGGTGNNMVTIKKEAEESSSITSTATGTDEVFLEQGGDGNVNLGGGTNKVIVGDYMWSGDYTGGAGEDSIIAYGRIGPGDIKLDGDSPTGDPSKSNNIIKVVGILDGSSVTSYSTGKDKVFIGGGTGNIALGGGENNLTIENSGTWSGNYGGGSGIDRILVTPGASGAAGIWNLGDGNNEIKGSGVISATINLGSGNDVIGDSESFSIENASLDLGSVNLGGGTNIVRASSAKSITGGAGNDKIYLRPKTSFTLSKLNLGAGSDSFVVIGGVGNPASRKVVLQPGKSPSSGVDTAALTLCNKANSADLCDEKVKGDSAFNVVLDNLDKNGSSVNIWGTINVKNQESEIQSLLTAKGNVSLNTARLLDFKLSADDNAGDQVAFVGEIALKPFHAKSDSAAKDSGTLFQLDFYLGNNGEISADSLVFGAGSKNGTTVDRSTELTSTVMIGLKKASMTRVAAKASKTVTLVTVANGSDVKDVQLQGMFSKKAFFNGREWTLTQVTSNTETTYNLVAGMEAQVSRISSASGKVKAPESRTQPNIVHFAIDSAGTQYKWDGRYKGGNGTDLVSIDKGVEISGRSWKFRGGNNVLKGSGIIKNYITMGDDDDVIGNFSPNAPSADNRLVLKNSVQLGGGRNRVMASEAKAIIAEEGDDTVILTGGAGEIELGDGENKVTANKVNYLYGGDGGDIFNLQAGAVSVDLGNGSNEFRASKVIYLYGGENNDTVILKPTTSFELENLELGSGINKLTVSGASKDATVTINLSGGTASNKSDFLYICNEINPAEVCDDVISESANAFNVTLDSSGIAGNTWDNIHIKNQKSQVQSVLTANGSLTFKESKLNNLLVAADGRSGDVITFDGKLAVSGYSISGKDPSGTGFEIDMTPGLAISDLLHFKPTTTNISPSTGKMGVSVEINVNGTRSYDSDKEIHFATIDPGSQVEISLLHGMLGDSMNQSIIILNNQKWSVRIDDSVGKKYYLTPGDVLPNFNLAGTEDRSASGSNPQMVTITKGWSGEYTGHSGIDIIKVNSGSHASGDWDLMDGYNVIKGDGTISGKVELGDGNDTIGNFAFNAPESDNKLKFTGEVVLGDGRNGVRAISVKKLVGGSGDDYILLTESAAGDISLSDGRNILKADDAKNITGGSGDDTVILKGFADGTVKLGGGENFFKASGAKGITGGEKSDTIILTPEKDSNLVEFNLGGGKNTVIIVGDQNPGLDSRKVTIPLTAGAPKAAIGTPKTINKLYICNEVNTQDLCDDLPEKTDHIFDVALNASGGENMWKDITVMNNPSTQLSLLTITGDVKLTNSVFNNLRFKGDDRPGDKITLTGDFGITQQTVFELDFGPHNGIFTSDLLVFDDKSKKINQTGFLTVPIINLKEKSGNTGNLTKGFAVTFLESKSWSAVTGVKLWDAVNNQITLHGHTWELKSSSKENGRRFYLELISLSGSSSSSESAGTQATGSHVLSAVSSVSNLPIAMGNQLGAGIGSIAGVSYGRKFSKPFAFGSKFISGHESGKFTHGSAAEYKNSFKYLNSDAEIFIHKTAKTSITHFLSLQHGLVKSDNLLQSTLSGVGYGVKFAQHDGMHFGASTSLTRIVTENSTAKAPVVAFSLNGLTIVAEAGYQSQITGSLNASHILRMRQSRFGNIALSSGAVLSSFQKVSGEIATQFSYGLGNTGHDGNFGILERNLYGEIKFAHDFSSGYKFQQGGNQTAVDSSKDWISFKSGVSWAISGGSFFAEASAEFTTDGLKSEKHSYTLGYNVKW